MTGNNTAQFVTMHELMHLEAAWRKRIESVLKMQLPAADAVATIQEMTVVQGKLLMLIDGLKGKQNDPRRTS